MSKSPLVQDVHRLHTLVLQFRFYNLPFLYLLLCSPTPRRRRRTSSIAELQNYPTINSPIRVLWLAKASRVLDRGRGRTGLKQ